jgi:hypothetical protein
MSPSPVKQLFSILAIFSNFLFYPLSSPTRTYPAIKTGLKRWSLTPPNGSSIDAAIYFLPTFQRSFAFPFLPMLR